MAMYTLKGIGEISTDAFDEKITLRFYYCRYKTKYSFSI